MFFVLPIIFTGISPFLGLNFSIVLISLFYIFKKCLFGSIFLTSGLPTLAGVATFKLESTRYSLFFQVFIPLLCMTLFICHPKSGPAFIYSFYWFIPVLLYFFNRKNIFAAALSSTFVAHAVGSILWLYSTNMSTGQWLMLIPVVAFERLAMAVGITFCYYIFNFSFTFIYRFQQQKV